MTLIDVKLTINNFRNKFLGKKIFKSIVNKTDISL